MCGYEHAGYEIVRIKLFTSFLYIFCVYSDAGFKLNIKDYMLSFFKTGIIIFKEISSLN